MKTMHQIDDDFEALLGEIKLYHFNVHSGPIYGVRDDFRIAYLNPGWFKFAVDNGGEPKISTEWGIGRSIIDCMPENLKELYEPRLKKCLTSHEVWDHEYECSSHEKYRRYHQIVYPLGKQQGLLIVNTLLVDRLHDYEKISKNQQHNDAYSDEKGLVNQCTHCRRVRNFSEEERWDWVPDWVKHRPQNVADTFCVTCYEHYFQVTNT